MNYLFCKLRNNVISDAVCGDFILFNVIMLSRTQNFNAYETSYMFNSSRAVS
jgi:hypothetical protein